MLSCCGDIPVLGCEGGLDGMESYDLPEKFEAIGAINPIIEEGERCVSTEAC